MKKVLPDTPKTRKYLYTLPKLYLIACWANYGLLEYPFPGKYKKLPNGVPIPLVYAFNDHNGFLAQYELVRIDETTTGMIAGWTFNKQHAIEAVEQYNVKRKINAPQ